MRAKLPGFDPFYNGWQAFEEDGLDAVNGKEAPIIMFALDQADPELADRLVQVHGSQDPANPENGLLASDLRFGMWPDASPVPIRAEGKIGVHLNTFGNHQVRYGEATEVERAGLEAITFEAEELVRDAIRPTYGAALFQFGKIPTLHRHIVAREEELDGLRNWKERPLVDLGARQVMREKLSSEIRPDRLEAIATHIVRTLGRYTKV